MADLRISQLPPLGGAALQADDVVAIVDLSASETKKITVKDLVQKTVTLIDAGSIPGDKVTVTLADGSVGTLQLADGSVTGIKLADNSTAVFADPLPATGQYTGQLGIQGGDPFIWNGTTWVAFSGGIVSIIGGTVGPVTTEVTTTGSSASVIAQIDDSTTPAAFLAGPTASAGAVELRTIVPADLPTATTTTAGIVTVPSGGGLAIDGGNSGFESNLVIDNDLTASGDAKIVTYDAKGLVTSGRDIEGGDLPIATNGTVGAVRPGTEFTIDPFGELNLANQVTPGGHGYVEYDGNGLITSGRDLVEDDIPDLNASKITSGTLDGSTYITDNSVDATKLDDYSTCYIQPNQPATAEYLGQMWLNPDTSQLYAYARGSADDYWLPVGFGRLQQENLRFCGTYDADASTILTLTEYGVTAGLALGALDLPTDEQTGVYLLCQTPGNSINLENLNGKSHTEGDWIVAINGKWEFIDVGKGGPGGGGASVLNDLLDVSIDTTRIGDVNLTATYVLAEGDILSYESSTGLWKNKPNPVPDKTSDLTNDGEDGANPFITAQDIPDIPENTSDLTNDSGFITAADVGDGTITIKKADGSEVGSFTVNQAGDTDISLPADVVPSAPGDGKLSIVDQDDNELFAFTADQATGTDTVVKLSAADVGALPENTPLEFVPLGSWANIPSRGNGGSGPGPNPGTPTVTLTSSSFTSGGQIGAGYRYDQGACGGQNINPQLSWQFDDLPDGASITSWEVSCVDTDASDFVHWTVTNIPASQTSIDENGAWEAGAVVGPTGYDPGPAAANGWGGPCPPPGEEHTYTIIVTARYNDGSDQTLSSDALTFLAATGTGGGGGGGGGGGTGTVTVTSTSFTDGAAIGQTYYFDQCGGSNTSPQLSWSATGLDGGRSVTEWQVTCVDVDAQGFVHWAVGQIPATQTSIAENGTWEAGAQIAQNGFGQGSPNGWGGPCPPEQHTYQITVRATLDDGSTIDSTPISFEAS